MSTLAGLSVPAAAFGELPAAARFAEGLDAVRQAFAAAAGRDVAARADQAVRTSTAARLGALLTEDTAAIAADPGPPPLATPGSILERMGGG